MRRLALSLSAGLILLGLLVTTTVALVGAGTAPAVATGLAAADATGRDSAAGGIRLADVNNFTFDSFDAEYRLGRDEQGHATLTTVETLVARFPSFDQNRGIRRLLPGTYQGRTASLQVVSVTDENGAPRQWEVEYGSVTEIVAAVPEGQYVQGVQTYVITYTQRDVVDYFTSTQVQEFYWNLNGSGWAQPFARVSGRVVLEDGLAGVLADQRACYIGFVGSTDQCELTMQDSTVSVAAGPILPFQTVTIALGFPDGTFTPFDTSYLSGWVGYAHLLAVILAVVVAGRAVVLRFTRYRHAPGRPTIIAEYEPPPGITVLQASAALGVSSRGVASQLIDFAVRGVLEIIEVEAKRTARRSTWRLRLINTQGVTELGEWMLLTAFFGSALTPGDEQTLSAQNTTLSRKIVVLMSTVRSSLAEFALRSSVAPRHGVGLTLLSWAAVGGAFVWSIILSEEGRGGALPWLLLLAPLIAVIVVASCLWRSPYTSRGAELRDHVRGLELYIGLAEADRLRMLQSPTGALREPLTADDQAARLRLYERLLPWAVLTRHEKEWAEVLGQFYTEQQPTWYSGTTAFSVATFSAGVGAVSATLASSYSGSSSSGGSGGGGSAGGGGGGGGGGGV